MKNRHKYFSLLLIGGVVCIITSIVMSCGEDPESAQLRKSLRERGYSIKDGWKISIEEIVEAAKMGKLEDIQLMVTYWGTKDLFNSKDNQGKTALIGASEAGHFAVVELLINNGVNINIMDNTGETALMKAAVRGHKEIVQLLIKTGADVNLRDHKGETALIKATSSGQLTILSLLSEKIQNWDDKDGTGKTALMYAVIGNHIEIVKYLLDKVKNVDEKDIEGRTALMYATIEGRIDIMELLFNKGAALEAKDRNGKSPFLLALDNIENPDILRLLKKTAFSDAGKFALSEKFLEVTTKNNVKMLQLLSEIGVDSEYANKEGVTAFDIALKNQNVQILSFLVPQGNMLSPAQTTKAFDEAIKSNNLEMLEFLVAHGADINIHLEKGTTSLSKCK